MKRKVSTVSASNRDDDGHPLVQSQPFEDRSQPFVLQHGYGRYARPHDPSDTGACALFVDQDGPDRYGWIGYDPRFLDDLPRPPKGSNVNYVAFRDGDTWKIAWEQLSGQDGTKMFYLPIGDRALTTVTGLDANGSPTHYVLMPDGAMLSMAKGAITMRSPSGKTLLSVSDEGITQIGNVKHVGGTAQVGGQPLAMATPTSSGLEAASYAVGALASLIGAIDPSKATAATAAASALSTAIGAILPNIPTKGTLGV